MAASRLLLLGLLPIAIAACLAAASCECGFSTQPSPAGNGPFLFTNAFETDFSSVKEPSAALGWRGQVYNVTAAQGRGRYGKSFTLDNIVACPSGGSPTDGCANSGAKGMTLRVGSQLSNRAVTSAEMATPSDNMKWGSYRCGMQLSAVNGTCASFFWYFNDTQEIDMELLSHEFDFENHVYPVNLVIQSAESMKAGYNAAKTGTFKKTNLTFDPTKGFHEYRFDYLPGSVLFYADSTLLAEMAGADAPSAAGHLVLQHWSNGNPLWSAGPPEVDSSIVVSYVKAYFNSSDADQPALWERDCARAKVAACVIPDTGADQVLACSIVVVVGAGLLHSWQKCSRRRRYENIDAARSDRLNRGVLEESSVDNVLFGPQALVNAVKVRGIWVARQAENRAVEAPEHSGALIELENMQWGGEF
ncbi:glycoside hydrolase family 16 protein [Cordyceps javanica]|uniref:Glycoside hydrolase family 16 protein n=1 Tax=Cordyceps javanica TaxID=43265 RepID=A0A545ULZ9_9HYPO|nr:glycoside hydrolase family 16 protein [Cordyceps javanica]TQW01877.1 glycoside hydrolase family 16 protein [Cordyceps javanica]